MKKILFLFLTSLALYSCTPAFGQHFPLADSLSRVAYNASNKALALDTILDYMPGGNHTIEAQKDSLIDKANYYSNLSMGLITKAEYNDLVAGEKDVQEMETMASVVPVKTCIYTAYFSPQLHEPLYVRYKLYKGGGDCSRAAFHFKNDCKAICTASAKDYSHSGYDEGHLANSEDFAGDCTKDELTFRFYNCLPQKPNLNRGCWKHYETLIRQWSQTDSLLIICGGADYTAKIGAAFVPEHCWKVVYSLSSHKLLHCGWYTNSDSATEVDITIQELEGKLGYKIVTN